MVGVVEIQGCISDDIFCKSVSVQVVHLRAQAQSFGGDFWRERQVSSLSLLATPVVRQHQELRAMSTYLQKRDRGAVGCINKLSLRLTKLFVCASIFYLTQAGEHLISHISSIVSILEPLPS